MNSLIIRNVEGGDVDLLADLFRDFQDSGAHKFFHPHGFSRGDAQLIANYVGRDVYCVVICGNVAVGYAMLRGRDEGFEVPSMGMGVHSAWQRRGIGDLMMAYLVSTARILDAPALRLKVYKNNRRGILLYEKWEFCFDTIEGEQMVGFKLLK